MSVHAELQRKTVRDLAAAKKATPLVCVTSYTAPMARIADKHADLLLVGDSLGMVIYGFDSTLPVTMDLMLAHGRAVVKASARAHVTVDMPFASYQESPEQAFRNAARLLAETGCQSVKLEGGVEMAETIAFLSPRGVFPVMGHIGLQPQSVNSAGGYRLTGRDAAEAARIRDDASAIAGAGAFAVVLECVDEALANQITAQLPILTIGIGASASCDGQVLVCDDLLGMGSDKLPKFVKTYGALGDKIDEAFGAYAAEVRTRRFPSEAHVYRARKSDIRAAS